MSEQLPSRAEREEQGLIDYPFPLHDGTMAWFWLPKRGITKDDSARLQEFFNSLVIEGTRD